MGAGFSTIALICVTAALASAGFASAFEEVERDFITEGLLQKIGKRKAGNPGANDRNSGLLHACIVLDIRTSNKIAFGAVVRLHPCKRPLLLAVRLVSR